MEAGRETEETKRSDRRSLMPKRVWIPAGILLGAMTGIPTLMMGVAALDTQPVWVGAAYIASRRPSQSAPSRQPGS